MDQHDGQARAAPMERLLYEVKKVIVGQDHLLERLVVALLARGHILVEGVPGLAKTMAIKTVADAIGGEFKRIQFTPDLVPADLVGTRIYNQKTGEFGTSLGPVFTNLLLADEINRAPAKVQSALLEVMQERQVTIGRETHKVPDPFLVLATQNPIETEGTYALPGGAGRPIHDEGPRRLPERDRGVRHRRADDRRRADRPAGPDDRGAARDAAGGRRGLRRPGAQVVRGPARGRDPRRPATHGLADLARYITYGASPRASINLILTARALAFVRGRDYALPRGRARHGARRPAPPARAVVRGALRRRHQRRILRTIIDRVPVPVVPLRSDDRVRVRA